MAAKPSSGRIAATGGIFAARRDGTITDDHGDADADERCDDDRAQLEHGLGVGETGPGGIERGDEPACHQETAEDADHRGRHAEDERLDGDHPAHLPAGRADGAQQCELAQPLADRDLEHVVDDERTHERGDEGEDQQARAEDVRRTG